MKKIRIVQTIGIILFCIYLGLFILDLIWGILRDHDVIIFSVLLAVISLSLIYKGVLLKSSSTLWFALVLIFSAILIMIFNLIDVDIDENLFAFAFIPIIASIFNLIIFKYIIYIKVIILNLSLIVPIVINKLWMLQWWWNVLMGIASVSLGIIVCRSINLGREKV